MRIPKPKLMPSGKYRVQVQVSGERICITADTEAGCIQKAMEAKQGLIQKGVKETFGQAIDAYIDSNIAVLSPSTIRAYKSCRKNHFGSIMGKKLDDRIDWQRVISEESKRGSPKSLKNNWGLICSTMRYMDMPVPKVRLPQVITPEHAFLDRTQIQTLMDAIRGHPIEKAVLLMLHGLRRSEIYSCSIDADLRQIRVAGAYVRGEDGFVLKKENKNSSSRRTVPIFIDRLLDLKDMPIGYAPESLNRCINLICLRNGLPEVGCHGLRHTFASLCYSQSIPVLQCQQWMGHSDHNTTLKIYTHLSVSDSLSSAEKLHSLF